MEQKVRELIKKYSGITSSGLTLNYTILCELKGLLQPQHKPFTYEDYMAFMDEKVKLDDCIGTVTMCNSYGVMVGGRMFSYESAFNDITFIDGSKFGKDL